VIGYGIALLAVCLLSLLDRRSLPFALILLAGWLAGFAGFQYWTVISILSGLALALALRRCSPLWARIIASCVPVMLLCDVVYFWALYRGVYIGTEYARCLDLLLSVQLLACSYPGARRGGRLLVVWLNRIDRRRMDRGFARHVSGDGSGD
jgi:hypothetical protein